MRPTRLDVLPAPAPASTKRLRSSSSLDAVAIGLVRAAIVIEASLRPRRPGTTARGAGRGACAPIRRSALRCRASRVRSTGTRCGTGTCGLIAVAGNQPASMPETTCCRSAATGAQTSASKLVADALVAAAGEERVLGPDRLEARKAAGLGRRSRWPRRRRQGAGIGCRPTSDRRGRSCCTYPVEPTL